MVVREAWVDSNLTPGDLVVVKWQDTEDSVEWESIQLIETLKPPIAKHVGWFLSQDEDCIRILPAICGDEASRSVIPKKSIISIEKIRDDELDTEA